ncbi:Predicted DNA-binding transcriptional regulator YafY, contains an HTH and WYL domains [Paenibacillus algorifonticola]|uniref:Predicted DNA-binding transcriptional regulator YafY, contains an HTH and WYL domains n=2 Tax=Paenibacillus algorifonticola TaxID=684063 RepID=A0A1I1Z4N5_9BACL|nr:Predicted DNA-binding transcriptional regulator YafY, contains an HTH and WYL domains [Paenibacillus algorifonticola]
MEALSAAGIPIVAERGTNGGWMLTEGYRTNLTGMKKEEIQSLLLSQPTGIALDLGISDNFESAFQKLVAAFPSMYQEEAEKVRQRIHIDGAGWRESSEQVPLLPLIQEAIWLERKLLILYSRGAELAERLVQPLGLVAKNNAWYLVADTVGGMRTYRISRLHEAAMQGETFDRPERFDLASYWQQSIMEFKSALPRYPAKIRIREAELPRFRQQWYVTLMKEGAVCHGEVEADVLFNTLESACEILLKFGSAVEALEPSELRQKLLQEVQAMVSLYAANQEE